VFLSLLAALLGIAAGGAAYVLVHLIGVLTNVMLLHQWGWDLPSLRDYHPDFTLVLAAVFGGFVVALLAKWSPVIRGHGIPEAMEAILSRQSRIQPNTAVAKPVSAAVAIGTGGPFGAEGPIIVTGGALGSLIGQGVSVSPAERKILLASGAAAGMAAIFGTPLAAVILAIELLLFEFSTRALVPLVVATSLGAGMHAVIFGTGPLFTVPAHSYSGIANMPVFIVLGLACGVLAVVVCKGLYLIEGSFRRLPIGEFWHPIIGAAGFALIGLAVPRALGVGYDVIDDVLANKLALATLAVLLIGKLVMWWIALASGTSGGTLAPILIVAGCFGSLFGWAVNEVAPGLHLSPGAIALVAMAATFGAATRATFTAIVFAFELTRDYNSILPLMLAAVIADLVSGALLDHGLMTEKLARRGLRVPRHYEPDVLRTTIVAQVMTRDVETLSPDSTIGEARRLFASGSHSAYPLVDDQHRCVGIVTRGDLLTEASDDDQLKTIASANVVSVLPESSLLEVLGLVLDEHIEHVPVVDSEGRLVGICTRTDLLRARARDLEHDRPQRGWQLVRGGAGASSNGNGHRPSGKAAAAQGTGTPSEPEPPA
jgi:H+/Cl- antiporter ClcA/CBS domain-containing protein